MRDIPLGPRSRRSSSVQSKCVSLSSNSREKVPLRSSVHLARFSSVNWPGSGPAAARTRFLNIALTILGWKAWGVLRLEVLRDVFFQGWGFPCGGLEVLERG